MVDNFPCISWPMGTGTLEHDTATVLPNANRARFLQLCQIQGRTCSRMDTSSSSAGGSRTRLTCPQTARGGVAVKCTQYSRACPGRRRGPEHDDPWTGCFCTLSIA